MLDKIVNGFYNKLISAHDQALIDIAFAKCPTQTQVDELLESWDIEREGSGKACLLSYVYHAHPKLNFGAYTGPRLKGLFLRNRFANLKLIAHFGIIGRRLNELRMMPMLIKGGAMKFLRPELPRDMNDIDFLLDSREEVERASEAVRPLGYHGEIANSNHAATLYASDGRDVMDVHWTLDLMRDFNSDDFIGAMRSRAHRKDNVFGVEALIPAAEDLLFIALINLAKNLRKKQTLRAVIFTAFDAAYLLKDPDFNAARFLDNVKAANSVFNIVLAIKFLNRIVPDLFPEEIVGPLQRDRVYEDDVNQAFFYAYRMVDLRRQCRTAKHKNLRLELKRIFLSIFNERPRLLKLYLRFAPPKASEFRV